MISSLAVSQSGLHDAVVRLSRSTGAIVCRIGVSRLSDRWEFLVPARALSVPAPLHGAATLVLRGASQAGLLAGVVSEEVFMRRHETQPLVVLGLGLSGAAGQVAGRCVIEGQARPLHLLSIVGPGLPLISLQASGSPSVLAKGDTNDSVRWSRTVGALGESTWRRLTELRFGIVGCGRTGSLVASTLGRVGVRHVVLLDPDSVEMHNLGEMDSITEDELGRHKTDALADSLRRQAGSHPLSVRSLPESVFSLSSLVAVKDCDVLVACCDNAAARIATNFLAKLYLKVLLDIGTGVLQPIRPGGANRIGADIRLLLPDHRCVLCFGGAADLARVSARLGDSPLKAHAPDWRTQRAGSLRSVNQVATGLGLRLLEEVVQSRLQDSTWLALDMDDAGSPQLTHQAPAVDRSCPLCRLAGWGDEGLHLLPSVVQEATRNQIA